MTYLLDTNIVTAIIKCDPKITTKLEIVTLILVSHDSDLSRITGLQLKDWLQDE